MNAASSFTCIACLFQLLDLDAPATLQDASIVSWLCTGVSNLKGVFMFIRASFFFFFFPVPPAEWQTMQVCLMLSSSTCWHPLISDHSQYSTTTLILVFLLFWRICCWLNEFASVIHFQYLMNGTGYESSYNPVMFPCSWCIFFFCATALPSHNQWAWPSSFMKFLDHTQRRTTVGRTPLDERSARRRDLYLTTHNTHDRHPCSRCDSNPHSQQASGRRKAQPLASVFQMY